MHNALHDQANQTEPAEQTKLTEPADRSSLVVVPSDPFNAEARLESQVGVLTPTAAFYVRNHFALPPRADHADHAEWRLTFDGAVDQPLALHHDELWALPSHTLLETLECAGNGRRALDPPAEGEPFGYGVVSTAEWTGVPLRMVLEEVAGGLHPYACEVLFVGADGGPNPEAGSVAMAFARSLPVARALHPDTLLAYAMNGEELPLTHGFPLRLLVPGWHGVASVKWLVRISVLNTPFAGFFQRERYILVHPECGEAGEMGETSAPPATPLTTVPPRSLLITPSQGATLVRGTHHLRGLAWSGAAAVARVEISVDDKGDDANADSSQTWRTAEWTSEPVRFAWRSWEYCWEAPHPGDPVQPRRGYGGQHAAGASGVESAGLRQQREPGHTRHDHLTITQPSLTHRLPTSTF